MGVSMVKGETRSYGSMNGTVLDLPLMDKFGIQSDQSRCGNGDQGLLFL